MQKIPNQSWYSDTLSNKVPLRIDLRDKVYRPDTFYPVAITRPSWTLYDRTHLNDWAFRICRGYWQIYDSQLPQEQHELMINKDLFDWIRQHSGTPLDADHLGSMQINTRWLCYMYDWGGFYDSSQGEGSKSTKWPRKIEAITQLYAVLLCKVDELPYRWPVFWLRGGYEYFLQDNRDTDLVDCYHTPNGFNNHTPNTPTFNGDAYPTSPNYRKEYEHEVLPIHQDDIGEKLSYGGYDYYFNEAGEYGNALESNKLYAEYCQHVYG